jgi:hypothetical protein
MSVHYRELIEWHPAPVNVTINPVIFTALPMTLTQSLLEKLSGKPAFMMGTHWSLRQLPVLARASIPDEVTIH